MFTAALYFILFFVGFLASEYVRFQYYLFVNPKSFLALLCVYGMAALSGISFFFGLKKLKLIDARWALQAGLGATFGVLWFGLIFVAEDRFSQNKLTQSFNLNQFSELTEHCGIQIGGRVAYFFKSPYESWKVSSRCRQEHWVTLEQNKHICSENLNCYFEMMERFAAKGLWSNSDRKLFYNLIIADPKRSVSDEAKLKFFILDQVLIKNRKPWFEQASLKEEFNTKFAVQTLEEEINTLLLTLEFYSSAIPSDGLPESARTPELNAHMIEVKLNLEKIPQLKADLERLKLNKN